MEDMDGNSKGACGGAWWRGTWRYVRHERYGTREEKRELLLRHAFTMR